MPKLSTARTVVLAFIGFQALLYVFLLYRHTDMPAPSPRTYRIVSGYFAQDDPAADAVALGPTPPFFGLLSRSWPKFNSTIADLAAKASPDESYKVIFFGRHGEGYHNVALEKYGERAWDAKWALLEGDGQSTWGPDPNLTPLGEGQARNANTAWRLELSRGVPIPQRLYVSPMKRAFRTYQLTFDGILPEPRSTPIILENVREEYGEHTCDKRRTRTEIKADFPEAEFEERFSEEDELWTWTRETHAQVNGRAKLVLGRIWEKDADKTYISITAHSGIINGFLRVLGRGSGYYRMPTGGIIVVVVKGTTAKST
ncbi:phosphoglycerate mutase-like protein [Auriscalpium vulgare]|uniref:Phosphoglycerate mutase-like protein n=1 Tax=Auriscalpium vulgare TaxID=40419 RepID=A0ACB8RF06_9AGAM|nr:phosphoglycerate mutase-like protein [Auriscalpium vulgare]